MYAAVRQGKTKAGMAEEFDAQDQRGRHSNHIRYKHDRICVEALSFLGLEYGLIPKVASVRNNIDLCRG